MVYYIYKIENKINHKIYIGLTNNIKRRRNRHFTDLNCNRHDNSFLQREFNIYGKEAFEFSQIYQGDVSVETIGELEKFYIEQYDSFHNGYNQNKGGNFGPANGGSHLVERDIYQILASVEFAKRPGTLLGQYYGISNTTVMRINRGENHCEYKQKYDNFPFEKKLKYFEEACEEIPELKKKIKNGVYEIQRLLSERQVHLILVNEENKRILPITQLTKYFNIPTSSCIYNVLNNLSYKEYIETYKNLTFNQKEELVTLLRNQQQKTH